MARDRQTPDPAPGGTPETPANPSRRAFFTATGIAAAAGIVAGGAGGAAIENALHDDDDRHGFTPLPARSEPGFDHVVVLMFENRSFDNLLGWLYTDDELAPGQKFDGLNQGEYSNTAPDGTVVRAHVYDGDTDLVMGSPNPDPGEFYPHVNTQLFDVVDPPGNSDIAKNGIQPPFNSPPDGAIPTNSGFLRDYVTNFLWEKRVEPTPEEYRRIMGGFSPAMLPVMSSLARNFAVYDHWYAAVPSQTFCNRSFFHASTSHGYVTNQDGGGYFKWLDATAPTVFNRLEEKGISWRVYYDEDQLVSLTGMLHAGAIEKYWKTNFRGMAQFHEDAANGTLPAYAFIEPRMVFNHNDMHPPFGELREGMVGEDPIYDSALSDVRAGEVLLSDVYRSIKDSASSTGSNAINTALIVTFDEHGGTYDHVGPPTAVPPERDAGPGEMGFTFDRLGCRVPAIVVSAYTKTGTVINEEMHHAAVIHTLSQLHGLKPLTRRDDTAKGIFNAVNLKKPRQPALWPTPHAAYVPPNPETNPAALLGKPHEVFHARPLTPPARGLLGILLAKYEPGAPIPDTYADAYDVLMKHGSGLFGTRDPETPQKPGSKK